MVDFWLSLLEIGHLFGLEMLGLSSISDNGGLEYGCMGL